MKIKHFFLLQFSYKLQIKQSMFMIYKIFCEVGYTTNQITKLKYIKTKVNIPL